MDLLVIAVVFAVALGGFVGAILIREWQPRGPRGVALNLLRKVS